MSEFINTIDLLGDDVVIDSIISGSITEFKDDVLTSLGDYAFASCKELLAVELPNVTKPQNCCFEGCTSLKRIYMPKANASNSNDIKNLFSSCTSLEEICLPALKNGGFRMCQECSNLRKVDLPSATYLHQYCFNASGVDTLILRSATLCTIAGSDVFGGTPIAKGTGYIYVPRALVDSYKAATNWSAYATQFRALEDYTVDGTITGELDETKI